MATYILLVSLLLVCATQSAPVPDTKAASGEDLKLKTLLGAIRQQINVEKLTAEYNRNYDWAKLRAGLEAVLSHDSAAYHQLQGIPTNGSDLKIVGEKGLTDLAAVIAILGSSPDITNSVGVTLLTGAAIGGKAETVALLLEAGANIEAKEGSGSTPLVLAAKHDHERVVRLLLSRGANVNGASYYGWSPLYWAADNGNLALVQYLVKAGAHIALKDRDGKSPVDIAKEKGHSLVEGYLNNISK